MRIHIRNHLRNPLRIQVHHHIAHGVRARPDLALLAIGAFLMVMGFLTDGMLGRGAYRSGSQVDVSSWMLFGGLIMVAVGALFALRRSHRD